jgi:hypothetical protein
VDQLVEGLDLPVSPGEHFRCVHTVEFMLLRRLGAWAQQRPW